MSALQETEYSRRKWQQKSFKINVKLQSNLHVRPPLVSDHLAKTQKNFPVKALKLETLVNDHLLPVHVSDHDYFMRLNKYLTQLTTRSAGMSTASRLAQAWSAFLASPPCAQYSVFLAAILFVPTSTSDAVVNWA